MRALRPLVAAIAAAIALSSCTRAGGGAAGELRIGMVSDPRSLNPYFDTAQNDIDVSQLYLEPLVGLSAQNELTPMLADPVPSRANGGISRDGMTIRYHLRPNARWADGPPVTSADVAFTYRAILDPHNPVTTTDPYTRIAWLKTPDAHTVVVRLKHPWVAAVSELFAVSDFISGILPAHAFAGSDLTHAAWNQHPFGSGPFRVTAWRHNDRIELEPNPYPWRKPHLARLVLRILPDQSTLFVGLQTHDVDVATLNEEQIPLARNLPGVRIATVRQNHTLYVEYETQRAPLTDPLVRRALVEAIDRDTIRRTVYLGFQPQATTEIPPIFAAHDASIPAWPYDPKAAAADLDAAGWRLHDGVRVKDGKPMQLVFAYVSTSLQARRMAVLYQEDLARIGVDLEVKGYPATTFFGGGDGIERNGRFDLAATEWYGGSDPEESEFFTCANMPPAGANTSFWCNHDYDALYARQMGEQNPTARIGIFRSMQRLVHDNVIGDWLVNTTGYTALSSRVGGWSPNMLFMFGNSENWTATSQ